MVERGSGRIRKKDVAEVARLAGLDLEEGQIARYAAQLAQVLEYMDTLKEVDTRGVEPTFLTVPLKNTCREDVVAPSQKGRALVDHAPEKEKDLFLVPKVI